MKCFKNFLCMSGLLIISSHFLSAEKTVFYDSPLNDHDTFCAVWTTERTYDGDLPELRKMPKFGPGCFPDMPRLYSKTKIYLNVAIISKDGSFSKLFSFPASLLVFSENLESDKLTHVAFAPRSSGDHYREFIAVEGNNLIKYEVGTNLKIVGGKNQLKLSTNFAKRRHIASDIDTSFRPWEDENGNIYYKAFDAKNKKVSSFYKWNGRTEQPEKQKKTIKADVEKTPEGEVTETENEVTLKLGDNSFTIPLEFEIVDPLESREGLNRDVLRELKLMMREEGGVMQKLLKNAYLSKTHVDSILAALDIDNGGAGVLEDLNKKGVVIVEGKIGLTLPDYRDLKKALKKKDTFKQLSSESAAALKDAILKYAKTIMSDDHMKNIVDDFMQVKEQKDWIDWFKNNKKVMFELMFDYLASLPEEKSKQELARFIKSQIKIRNLLRIINFYKKSELFSGLTNEFI